MMSIINDMVINECSKYKSEIRSIVKKMLFYQFNLKK